MNALINRLAELNAQQTTHLLHTLALSDPDFSPYSQGLTTLSKLSFTAEQQSDLARKTLLALAERNPERAEAIDSLLINPAPQRFEGGITIATLVCVAVLLRTHVKFKRNLQGKWELLIEHKPANNSVLNKLLKNIQALLEQQ